MSGNGVRLSDAGRTVWTVTDLVLFSLLVALLGVRPLMSETYASGQLSFLPRTGAGPTPGTTVLLDALLLMTAAAALVRHPPRSRTEKVCAVCAGVLIASAIVSSAAADEKRVAVNASSSLCVTVLAGGALIKLSRERWSAVIILAVLSASGVAAGWKCIAQWGWEFDQTREYWDEQKRALIESGRSVDDPNLVNFERRLAAREPFAYLSHPNLAASCLMISLVAGVGLIAGLVADRSIPRAARGAPLIVAGALAGIPAFALGLTGSLGAGTAAIAGVALFLLVSFGTTRIASRPVRSAAILLAAYGGLMVCGAAYGIVRGTLPHPSLAFRWHYWTSAASAWQTAPLTGIGRENFAGAFEHFKPAESPEEVRDAHNVWVTLLVEMGPAALVAAAALIVLWLAAAFRGLTSGTGAGPASALSAGSQALPLALVPLLHAGFSRSEVLMAAAAELGSNTGRANPVLLFTYWFLELACLWAAGYVCALAAARPLTDGGGRWLKAGFIAAMLAVVLHNLVDFSLNTPAGGALAALVCAGALAGVQSDLLTGRAARAESWAARSWRAGHPAAWVAAAVMVVSHLMLVVAPTLHGERTLEDLRRDLARAQSRSDAGAAMLSAETAAKLDRWDAETPREIAAIAAHVAELDGVPREERIRWLRRGLEMVELSIHRAPRCAETWRMAARTRGALARAFEDSPGGGSDAMDAARASLRDWERSVELYPAHARTRIEAARAYFYLWQRHEPAAAPRAVELFESALALNERFPAEEVVRLSREELASVNAHLRQLAEAGSVPATRPAATSAP